MCFSSDLRIYPSRHLSEFKNEYSKGLKKMSYVKQPHGVEIAFWNSCTCSSLPAARCHLTAGNLPSPAQSSCSMCKTAVVVVKSEFILGRNIIQVLLFEGSCRVPSPFQLHTQRTVRLLWIRSLSWHSLYLLCDISSIVIHSIKPLISVGFSVPVMASILKVKGVGKMSTIHTENTKAISKSCAPQAH